MDDSGFNLSTVFATLAEALPDHRVLIWRGREWTYAQLDARVDGVAHYLASVGLGCHTERDRLQGHESGQDHIGLYLRNGNEYLESMIGAYRARVAPFNVNYRYVEAELVYLLDNAKARALVYSAEFAPRVAAIRDRLPHLEFLIQVADHTGQPLLPGAVDYESIVATPPPASGMPTPSGDDLYILYTGGTTGMPKGVLWRQNDIFVSSMGGRAFGTDDALASYDELAERAAQAARVRLGAADPAVHARRGPVGVVSDHDDGRLGGDSRRRRKHPRRPDSGAGRTRTGHEHPGCRRRDRTPTRRRDRARRLRPLGSGVDQQWWRPAHPRRPKPPSRRAAERPDHRWRGSLRVGYADERDCPPSPAPNAMAAFTPGSETAVVAADFSRSPGPGGGEGWLARRTFIPLGYLGDAEKTARTFPVIDGVRWSVPGDRARFLADGRIELLGRDSVTINSGGEKIFAEEVEAAMAEHPDVYDVVVAGRPSERWGNEVVAIVQLGEGRDPSRRGSAGYLPATCRALQTAEGHHPHRQSAALAGRQGRLSLGQRHCRRKPFQHCGLG